MLSEGNTSFQPVGSSFTGSGDIPCFARRPARAQSGIELCRAGEPGPQSFFEEINKACFECDETGEVLRVNGAAARLFGCPREELISQNLSMLCVSVPYRGGVSASLLARESLKDVPVKLTRRDGLSVFGYLSAVPASDNGSRQGSFYGVIDVRVTGPGPKETAMSQRLDVLELAFSGLVNGITLALESRDPYAAGHQRRVARLARAIAEEIGYSSDEVEGIGVAGSIHDLGKIAIPSEILTKPGKMTHVEFSLIKTHAQAGFDILKSVEFPWPVAETVLQHHERLDGSGYPQGLTGNRILPEAKIIAVADTVEAMTTYRPYRKAYGIDQAIEEIVHSRGRLFDPVVVDACVSIFNDRGFEFGTEPSSR